MSLFTFSNVFNYMNQQYPGATNNINGDDVLQELRLSENTTKTYESDQSDSEMPTVSSVCNTYPGEVRIF